MDPQNRSIPSVVLPPESLDFSHPSQREEQHDLNTPPDHMPLGCEFGSVEGQIIDPHVEVG